MRNVYRLLGEMDRYQPNPTLVVAGLYAVLALLIHIILGSRIAIDREDQIFYLLLGSVVPAIALAWALHRPGGRGGLSEDNRMWQTPARLGALVLSAFGVALAIPFGLRSSLVAVVIAAVLQAVVLLGFARSEAPGALLAPGVIGAGLLGWAVSLDSLPEIRFGSGWDDLPLVIAVVALTSIAACWWSADRGAPSRHRAITVSLDLLAAVAVIMLSFRTDGFHVSPGALQDVMAMFHHAVFTGPAMMIRDGGWLYWDVPSQYGFLGILAIAAFPASTWQATYLIAAAMNALMFIGVYIAVRGVRRGLPGQLFALLITVSLFFTVMDTDGAKQHHYFPSVGGIRYLWSVALVGVLALERRAGPGSDRQRALLIAGTGIWLVSVLWSVECAFYATVIWFPGYLIAVVRDRARPDGRFDVRAVAGWLLYPVLLFAATVAGIAAVYLAGLGHLPDPIGYIDTALALRDNLIAGKDGWPFVVERYGLVMLAVVQTLGVIGVIAVVIRRFGWPREIGILIGVGAMLWSWTGYLLGRKISEGAFISLPAAVIAAAVCIGILIERRQELPLAASWGYRAIALPMFAVIAAAVLSRPDLIALNADLFRQPSTWRVTDVTLGIPEIDPELEALFLAAGATPEDPIAYSGNYTGNLMGARTIDGVRHVEFRPLTSNFPFILTTVLSPERRAVFMERWAERHPRGGWIIQSKQDGKIAPQYLDNTGPWFWDQMFRTHVPTRAFASEHWDLLRVEPAAAEAPRPALATGRWMLNDALLATTAPGVLASWADPAVSARGNLAMIPEGMILNLYSDAPQVVRVAVEGKNHRGYDLALDGVAAGFVDPANGKRNAVDLALPAGWSWLSFSAGPPAPGADPAMFSRLSAIRIDPVDPALPPETAPDRAGRTSPDETRRADESSGSGRRKSPASGAQATPVAGDTARQPTTAPVTGATPAARSGEPMESSRDRKRNRKATPAP